MALGQSSFRRILLSRLLLVSVPVLLVGVYVTYRKARSAFLETARQNLTESAVRKGEGIDQKIEALQANLATASDSVVLKLGSQTQQQAFLDRLSSKLTNQIECIQLSERKTARIVASTCGDREIDNLQSLPWAEEQQPTKELKKEMYVKFLLPEQHISSNSRKDRLELLLSVPVYNGAGTVRYILSFKSALLKKESQTTEPGSLTGYTVVIDEKKKILMHPFPERIGRNIMQEADAQRLKDLVNNAIAGKSKFLHLFAFDKDGVELVAGYTAIASPISGEEGQKWVILAVAPIEQALAPLKDIQHALIGMTCALIVASSLVMLYISRELARPLEKLRDYATNKDIFSKREEISQNCPPDFRIKEFNQLAISIQGMLERLQAWSDEIVSSWQEAQNANQLKNEFLATTSHELRTPLNGIINCIRVIKEGYCDDREEEIDFLQQADTAAVHLINIINDILDIAKIEAGKLSVRLEPVELSKIVKDVIHLQTVALQKKGLKLKTPQWEDNIIIDADPDKLRQVLLNIIGNAVKFTQSGGIEIKTRIEYDRTDAIAEGKAIVTVRDTGIGIDPQQQDKLFRPFVMVDGSTTRQFGGTGLGLAISRNLVELMGGSISLHSAGRGRGTTVKIVFPLAQMCSIKDVNSLENDGNNSQRFLGDRNGKSDCSDSKTLTYS
jgi:two-component system, NarL family, sensor histidine kinase BarA